MCFVLSPPQINGIVLDVDVMNKIGLEENKIRKCGETRERGHRNKSQCSSAGWSRKALPIRQKVAGSIPGQGAYGKQPIVSLTSMFLALSASLSPFLSL